MNSHVTFRNEINEIERLHDYFMAIGQKTGIGSEELNAMNLAVEEVVANVINYAYPKGEEGTVDIDCEWIEGGDEYSFVVSDHGVPFDPTQEEDPDLTLGVDDRPIGGLGIFLARTIMDKVEYQRTNDGRNVLRLVYRTKPSDGDPSN